MAKGSTGNGPFNSDILVSKGRPEGDGIVPTDDKTPTNGNGYNIGSGKVVEDNKTALGGKGTFKAK